MEEIESDYGSPRSKLAIVRDHIARRVQDIHDETF